MDDNSYAVTDVGFISPSPMNPRKHFPQQALDELVGKVPEEILK